MLSYVAAAAAAALFAGLESAAVAQPHRDCDQRAHRRSNHQPEAGLMQDRADDRPRYDRKSERGAGGAGRGGVQAGLVYNLCGI